MKQVVQNLRSGILELMEVPCPAVRAGHLRIASRSSVISAGTERMLVEFGKANLVAKARQQPERVKQVLDKIRADGLMPTLEAVFAKLDEPLPLGYCNAGVVLEVGAGVDGFAVGDRVASNGGHAEVVVVPKHLCAKIPTDVSDEQACFAVLGAIAMQGVRLLRPQLGESVAVFGLGLVGLLTVQLLRAAGVRVLAIDLHKQRLELAAELGAQTVDISCDVDPIAAALQFTGQRGVDGVIIAASAKGDQIVNQSAQMTRQRGRIVQVGATQLDLNRAHFYEKEITVQVSCSYGPGRYDASYEQGGNDYPFGFVRWTEQRNIAAVLDLMARKDLDVSPLITSRVPHAEAERAYDLVSNDRDQLGVILHYGEAHERQQHVVVDTASDKRRRSTATGQASIGFIGAGAFAKGVLLPAFCGTDARLVSIASAGGLSAAHAARKFGVERSTTDYRQILSDDSINTVVITTRHHQHASMVVEALQAGKHVFVEKPLAIDQEGLRAVVDAASDSSASNLQLMVGFNRRFAPLVVQAHQRLASRTEPLCMVMYVNAGNIPSDHWAHDMAVGGGRIIGEGCHWLDLLTHLAGAPIERVDAVMIAPDRGTATCNDHMSITMTFGDGSIGTLHYFANGHRAYPKEKLTISCQGRILELDNFRSLRGYGWKGFSKSRLYRQDKGHRAEVATFVERVSRGGPPLIPLADLVRVTEATFEAEASARR